MVIFIGSITMMLSMNDLNASFLGRWNISEMFISIYRQRIAGYVTAKKKQTGIFEYKKRRNRQLLYEYFFLEI